MSNVRIARSPEQAARMVADAILGKGNRYGRNGGVIVISSDGKLWEDRTPEEQHAICIRGMNACLEGHDYRVVHGQIDFGGTDNKLWRDAATGELKARYHGILVDCSQLSDEAFHLADELI